MPSPENKKIKIPGRLIPATTEGVVVGTDVIIDETLEIEGRTGYTQAELNQKFALGESGPIGPDRIEDGSITPNKIAPNAIVPGKIDVSSLNTEDLNLNNESEVEFANRAYNATTPNGMGYKILRQGDGLTFANQVTETNTIYEIRYNFDLGNQTVNVPENATLYFNGGKVSNGTLNGNNGVISSIIPLDKVMYNTTLTGSWEYNLAEQTQSDWEQTDDTAPDYIKNKPEITDFVDRQYNPSEYSGLGRVYLQKNIVNVGGTDKNILGQDAFTKDGEPMTNTVFAINYDFDIGSRRVIDVTIGVNEANLISPDYIANSEALSILQDERQALIDGGATEEQIEAIDERISAQAGRLNDTPQYYYCTSVTIPAHKVLHAQCPGCMFLDEDLEAVLAEDSCFGSLTDDEDTTVYVAYIYQGTYQFTEDSFIAIPDNSVLEFNGGSISNGTIKGNHTSIIAPPDAEIFKDDVIIKGVWDIAEIYDNWFKYVYTADTANNQVINDILGLTHDDYGSTVHFTRDTTYLVELPTVPLVLKGGIDQSCRQYTLSLDYDKKIRTGPWGYGARLDAITMFRLNSNTRYVIDSTIQMLPTGDNYYRMFGVYKKENVIIEGRGTLIGDNYENGHLFHQYYPSATNYGEWGFIIRVSACKNFVIKDITLNGSFGDNLYLGGSNASAIGIYYPDGDTEHILPTDGVTIQNVRVLYARRNGIAISVSNAIVEGCFFEGNGIPAVTGTAPRAGIDFECDQGTASLNGGNGAAITCNRNVVMTSCVFRNNEYDISSTANRAYGEDTVETYIKNCAFTSPLRLNKTAGLQFEDCYIPLVAGKGDSIWYLAASENINFFRCIFEDSNIRMMSYTSSDDRYSTVDSIKFVDCIYFNDFKIEDHAYVYSKADQMAYLRCKLPGTNSDYLLQVTLTFAGKINSPSQNTGIVIMEYAFRITSSGCRMLKMRVNSARGSAFDFIADDNPYLPKIGERVIDGYRYLFISNPNFSYYSVGVDYCFNCCKLTNSTSETEFVHIDVDPSVGVFTETEEINKTTMVFDNPINDIVPGNYHGGYGGVINAGVNSPFFYRGRVLFPDGSNVRDNNGEIYDIKKNGTTSQMPTPTNIGFQYINTGNHMPLWWDGEMFMYGDGVRISAKRAGVTADRPTGRHTEYANPEDPTDISPTQDSTHTEEVQVGDLGCLSQQGFVYFDTTLGKPVYAKEINSTTGVITWVDATGTPA